VPTSALEVADAERGFVLMRARDGDFVVATHNLDAHTLWTADVSQTTWLRLAEHLDRIRDPERLGGWLATTARHESLRAIRRGTKEQPTGEADLFEEPSDEAIDRLLLDRERDGALWRAFAALTDRCKSLLRLLMADEEPTYEEIGAALGMPIGAIGPTRMRCLDRLRRSSEVLELAT